MQKSDVVVIGGGQAGPAAAPRHGSVGELGDVVAVPPVREARDNGLLVATPMNVEALPWADVVVWCAGFRPALSAAV